nr:glycoside hydrolase family 15 protein [Streptomyces regalis]
MALEFGPRPEYGRVVPALRVVEGGVRARGGPAALALSSFVPLTVSADQSARGTVRLSAGEATRFALHYAALPDPRPRILSQEDIAHRLSDTVTAWHRWSAEHQNYDGPWRDQVRFAGRVLQALSYQPTGAIVAAPTTSLPERAGGRRNWDYRSTADAAATGWTRTHLQIMYGIGGEHDLTERELPHLFGWKGSRPVRVGNAAWNQPQVDVYGELPDSAARFAPQLDTTDGTQRAFLMSLADAAVEAWHQPDHGIWEIRGAPRHFLHSKLMCWVALDRALKLADRLGAQQRAEEWRSAHDEIRTAIERHGFSETVGAFTQSFGSTALDTSALMLPITGFLPATDPRVPATLDAITEHLTRGQFPAVHLLARPGPSPRGAHGPGPGDLRAGRLLRQRPRPALRTGRPTHGDTARQLPPRPSAISDWSTPPGPSTARNRPRPTDSAPQHTTSPQRCRAGGLVSNGNIRQ